MRLFQNSGVPPSFVSRRRRALAKATSFKSEIARFLDDRYGALHFLAPVLNGDDTALITNGDDEVLQRIWARERGLPAKTSLTDILLAQIESHRTEVFYNLDPIRYGNDFVRKLPGCVRKAIAWRNAPSPIADLSAYDLILCNATSMLRKYHRNGWKAEYFSPAHDPVMDEYAGDTDRPIDFLFVGGYSRHHMRRAAVLETLAGLRDRYRIEFCLARSRFTRLAESPLGYLASMGKYRRPRDIRAVSRDPVYGRDLYTLISQSKIVLNGAGDAEGEDRGNMRCFEAMGCSALLLGEAGVYPKGMQDGETLLVYSSPLQVSELAQRILGDWSRYAEMAKRANQMVRSLYSKEHQWTEFNRLVASI
jgi:Glycosyl transferases group 1